MSRLKFFEDEENKPLKTFTSNLKDLQKSETNEISSYVKQYRYRAEQTLLTKLDGIVVNNGTTKREFIVDVENANQRMIVGVAMVENVITFNPKEMEDAISLLCDIDNIKCNIKVRPNPQTGRIEEILNHEEILKNWVNYKKESSSKYAFLRKPETAANMEKFMRLVDVQISSPQLLKNDIQTKLFIELLFDKYLVGLETFEAYTKEFGSQLFENNLFEFNFSQNILSENEHQVLLERVGKLNRDKLDLEGIEKQYDQKFKPIIGYQFSEFNFEIKQKIMINTSENIIEKADVLITEEVKNNVQVLINYDLKRVEL